MVEEKGRRRENSFETRLIFFSILLLFIMWVLCRVRVRAACSRVLCVAGVVALRGWSSSSSGGSIDSFVLIRWMGRGWFMVIWAKAPWQIWREEWRALEVRRKPNNIPHFIFSRWRRDSKNWMLNLSHWRVFTRYCPTPCVFVVTHLQICVGKVYINYYLHI